MYLEINDENFKKAVREEVSKTVLRDAKNEMIPLIDSIIKKHVKFSDEAVQKAILKHIDNYDSLWRSNYGSINSHKHEFKQLIVDALKTNLEALFEKVARPMLAEMLSEYYNAYSRGEFRIIVKNDDKIQAMIKATIEEKVKECFKEHFKV